MLLRHCVFVACSAWFLGCEQAPPAPAAPAASASAKAAEPAPAAAEPAPPPPADLDVAELQKALKCAADAKTGPCGVLSSFASCSPWSATVPSGDGRWMGRGWLVEGGKTTEQVTLVRARRVGTAEVGPGQLGAKIAIADVPADNAVVFEQAQRAIRIYERSDTPPPSNVALQHVKSRTEWPEAFATRTVGGQVYAISHAGAFFCQGTKQRLVLVRRAASRGTPGDALYAELWPASW